MLPIGVPFPQYFDLDGSPLDGGSIFFGQPNQNPETSPIEVYWDSAGTQPAAQPVRTINGYMVRNGTPANVFVDSEYSVAVKNAYGQLVYYIATSDNFDSNSILRDELASPTGASMIGYSDTKTVADELEEFDSFKENPVVSGLTSTQRLLVGNGDFDQNKIPNDPLHVFEVVNDNSPNQVARFNSYGETAFGNNVHYCRYFGTQAAPTAIKDGAFLMSTGYRGYNGSALSQSMAAFQVVATEDWTTTANGIRFQWEVAPKGTITRAHMMELDGKALSVFGNVGVGRNPKAEWNANYKVVELGQPGCVIRGHGTNAELAVSSNAYFDTAYKRGAAGGATVYFQSNGEHTWSVAGSGAADSSISFIEAMRLDASANLLVGTASGSSHQILKDVAADAGNPVLLTGKPGFAMAFYGTTGGGSNTANASIRMGKDAVTNRSINAGGTLNASGADYAEYMRKAEGCGEIQKGAIVGINANGEVTDKWADSITFMVKSTDPSYVGGDTWGSEEVLGKMPEQPSNDADDDTKAQYEQNRAAYAAKLEAARQCVDRIAFAGQVPVNVMSATPGDYIIPVQDGDGITGASVASPTLEQYMRAVGKVIAIEGDGRARIIVKVA